MKQNNQHKYLDLRRKYNKFTYEKFDFDIGNDQIDIKYTFNLSDSYTFSPEINILRKNFPFLNTSITKLENMIFHIGMIEMVSYWKATCSPLIEVKPFHLSEEQVQFWKKLYFYGLGEFFYTNGINPGFDEFVDIMSTGTKESVSEKYDTVADKVIVPVGGGKDSAVTLEILKDHFDVRPFILNPRKACIDTVMQAGLDYAETIVAERKLDQGLLKLNDQGFLNGHTPFSALLGFVTLPVAALSGAGCIALSNESSANEPTVQDGPNHQYSKSFEFEKDFREYVEKYIGNGLNYFSFLRPLQEFTIASLFSGYKDHFETFRSCNVGSKTNSWCGKCSKCLFTAVILAPFLSENQLFSIFGKDMLDDISLKAYLLELTGQTDNKPFECVGTIDEINRALHVAIKKYDKSLPALLEFYKSTAKFSDAMESRLPEKVHVSDEHFLPERFLKVLTDRLNEG